eukprot:TRINITY_DN1856_c0_g1_i1.p1 TRINITY_DN1856_c0_g1~~TRINITY_DN1856_c0_g1_i1.p1  ORF type:complete len:595 (-),score=158.67 TRINITY_DN1856_c0_g1_i1:24-1808(-)
MNKVLVDMQRFDADKEKEKMTIDRILFEIQSLRKEDILLLQSFSAKEKIYNELTSSLGQLKERVSSIESELKTDMRKELSEAEEQELVNLSKDLSIFKDKLSIATNYRTEKEMMKNNLENQLNANILKRQSELRDEVKSINNEEEKLTLDAKKDELKDLTALLHQLQTRYQALENYLKELTEQNKKRKEDVDTNKKRELKISEELRKEAFRLEKSNNRRGIALQMRDECTKKIRELGSLPADAFDKFTDLSLNDLMERLGHTNTKLKNYSHVNKKAFEQYTSFTEKRDELNTRKEDLDKAKEAIIELINTLDTKKDKAVDLTFKGVAKNFSDVFAQLVPGGKASLIMQKQKRAENAEDSQSEGEGSSKIRQYTGIAIKVSFNGDENVRLIQELSGGQKSLVALTLIFAIQRCDPAPFYLFDEIDAALDANHRAAVARLIDEQSAKAQFIITTFRPELVDISQKFYSIVFKDKVSSVKVVKKEDALQVIKAAESEAAEAEIEADMRVFGRAHHQDMDIDVDVDVDMDQGGHDDHDHQDHHDPDLSYGLSFSPPAPAPAPAPADAPVDAPAPDPALSPAAPVPVMPNPDDDSDMFI